jgi:hypothetical protein
MAVVVEAVAVDDAAILDEAEGARTGVARLRTRGQRADLDEAEAEAEHGVGDVGVLVEARREPDRIGKIETEGRDRESRIVLLRRARRQSRQRGDGGAMGGLGVEQAQQGQGEAEGVGHGRPVKSCPPSARDGSGATRVTASGVSGA